MGQVHAPGDALAEAAELFAHGQAQRLEGLEPRAATGDADSQAAGRAVVDHGKDGHLPDPESKACGGVDAPHLVEPPGDDGSLVPVRLDGLRLPLRASSSGWPIRRSTPRNDVRTPARRSRARTFAVAFAVQGRALDGKPDLPGGLLIGVAQLRAVPRVAPRPGEASQWRRQ